MHLAFLEEFPFRIRADRSSPADVILAAAELSAELARVAFGEVAKL